MISTSSPGEQWVINQQINTNTFPGGRNISQAKLIAFGTSFLRDEENLSEDNYMLGIPNEKFYSLYDQAHALLGFG